MSATGDGMTASLFPALFPAVLVLLLCLSFYLQTSVFVCELCSWSLELRGVRIQRQKEGKKRKERAAGRRWLPCRVIMALDNYYRNKIEGMKLEIIQGQAVLRRLEAQRNDYNSRVRLLREELGLLQQPGSYVGEVVKVMSTKKVLVKVHPEGKYGMFSCL